MLHDPRPALSAPHQFTVFCYASGTPGDWEALCLDFNISVQGSSFEEVKEILNGAVRSYVIDACNEEPRVRDQLLARRAPWLLRVRIGLALAFQALTERYTADRSSKAAFPLPCHA